MLVEKFCQINYRDDARTLYFNKHNSSRNFLGRKLPKISPNRLKIARQHEYRNIAQSENMNVEILQSQTTWKYVFSKRRTCQTAFYDFILSKCTWGEQPVEDIPIFTCICVNLSVYSFVSRLKTKRKTIQTWNLAHILPLTLSKNGFLFFRSNPRDGR